MASAAAEAAAKKRKVKRRDLKAKIRELEAANHASMARPTASTPALL